MSVGVFPPGLDHFCPLIGGCVDSAGVFPPGMGRLCSLVGGFQYFGRRFYPGDEPFVSPGWGLR